MERRNVGGAVVLSLVAIAIFARLFLPERFDSTVEWGEEQVSGAPDELVIAVSVIVIIAVWIVAMIYLGRLLYWCWKQIDSYVLWVWDTILPENPIVRFGVGLTFMALVFLVGPLVVLSATDFMGSGDPVEENGDDSDTNDTDDDTGQNETQESLQLSLSTPVVLFAAGWGPPTVSQI